MKTYLNRTIINSIGNEAVQSVAIEKEENDVIWCLVRHDNEYLSMSYDNLKILQDQINNAVISFEKEINEKK